MENLKIEQVKTLEPTQRQQALVKAFQDTEFTLSSSGWLSGGVAKLGGYDKLVHGQIVVTDNNPRSDNPLVYEISPYYMAAVELDLKIRVTDPAEAFAAVAYLKTVLEQEFNQLQAIAERYRADRDTKAAEATALEAYAAENKPVPTE